MTKQLIIRGQVLELPKTPLRNSLKTLLVQRGFKEAEMDFSEFSYGAAEGYHKAGKSWDICSSFINEPQQVLHHLIVHEYRLFKDPIDILNSQFIENIYIQNGKGIYLKINKIIYSMYSEIGGINKLEKSKLNINEGPQEYSLNKVMDFVNSFLDFSKA